MIDSGDLYCMIILITNRSASSGALIVSLVGKYLAIFVYQSTTTSTLSYTCLWLALSGSLIIKSIVIVVYGQVRIRSDDSSLYSLYLCVFEC